MREFVEVSLSEINCKTLPASILNIKCIQKIVWLQSISAEYRFRMPKVVISVLNFEYEGIGLVVDLHGQDHKTNTSGRVLIISNIFVPITYSSFISFISKTNLILS